MVPKVVRVTLQVCYVYKFVLTLNWKERSETETVFTSIVVREKNDSTRTNCLFAHLSL